MLLELKLHELRSSLIADAFRVAKTNVGWHDKWLSITAHSSLVLFAFVPTQQFKHLLGHQLLKFASFVITDAFQAALTRVRFYDKALSSLVNYCVNCDCCEGGDDR